MKSILFCSFLFLQFFCGCANSDEKKEPAPTSENDVDAARNFINSVLKSNFKEAKNFVVQDSLNYEYLDATERSFKDQLTDEDRRQYKEASINIHSINPVNDTVSFISYSNSYKKKNERLKVVKRNDQWLVDLKYTFSPEAKDSLP